MQGFQILFHGRFEQPNRGQSHRAVPYEGFYTSRIIESEKVEDAIVRGRELIRGELDRTISGDNQLALISLEAETFVCVEFDDEAIVDRGGFSFY